MDSRSDRHLQAEQERQRLDRGALHPMVASDGPHYGANVKLDGPGAYQLVFEIAPPSAHGFMRHVDKETGGAPWWKSFQYKGEFKFVGTGKKGGY